MVARQPEAEPKTAQRGLAQRGPAQRGLIVAPAWIGDAIMAQPLFMRLHERYPGIELCALAPPWVEPVLRRMPEISEVIASPFAHGELAWKKRWRLGRQLGKEGFFAAWVLPNSLKSALVPFFAGIGERVGFTGEARLGLLNRRHRLDRAALPLMVERFAKLAAAPDAELVRPLPLPRLTSSSAQQAKTLKELALSRPAKLAVFCPGAEYGPAKRWPARHFATLAKELAARGYTVWLLGSAKDAPIGAAIAAQAPAALNLCGLTGLAEAIDLIALADWVVCNDSGLMHVAAALDRPLAAIYGSSSPQFTPPLSAKAKVLSLNLACSPCFKRECPLGHLDCLEKLLPQLVLAECPP